MLTTEARLPAGAGSPAGEKCQQPKNDLLASMCPKWVPDILSAPSLWPLHAMISASTGGTAKLLLCMLTAGG